MKKTGELSIIDMMELDYMISDDINITNDKGANQLMYQIAFGDEYARYEITKLLKNNINVDQRIENGKTALHLAALKGDYATVKKLIDGNAYINMLDKDGNNALMDACKGIFLTFPDETRSLGFEEEETQRIIPIYQALYDDPKMRNKLLLEQLKIIRLLLSRGIDVYQENSKGTAMDIAIENKLFPTTEMVRLLGRHYVPMKREHEVSFSLKEELSHPKTLVKSYKAYNLKNQKINSAK